MRYSLIKVVFAVLVIIGAVVEGTAAVVFILRGGTFERPEQQSAPPAASDTVIEAPGLDHTITTPLPPPLPEMPRPDEPAKRGQEPST